MLHPSILWRRNSQKYKSSVNATNPIVLPSSIIEPKDLVGSSVSAGFETKPDEFTFPEEEDPFEKNNNCDGKLIAFPCTRGKELEAILPGKCVQFGEDSVLIFETEESGSEGLKYEELPYRKDSIEDLDEDSDGDLSDESYLYGSIIVEGEKENQGREMDIPAENVTSRKKTQTTHGNTNTLKHTEGEIMWNKDRYQQSSILVLDGRRTNTQRTLELQITPEEIITEAQDISCFEKYESTSISRSPETILIPTGNPPIPNEFMHAELGFERISSEDERYFKEKILSLELQLLSLRNKQVTLREERDSLKVINANLQSNSEHYQAQCASRENTLKDCQLLVAGLKQELQELKRTERNLLDEVEQHMSKDNNTVQSLSAKLIALKEENSDLQLQITTQQRTLDFYEREKASQDKNVIDWRDKLVIASSKLQAAVLQIANHKKNAEFLQQELDNCKRDCMSSKKETLKLDIALKETDESLRNYVSQNESLRFDVSSLKEDLSLLRQEKEAENSKAQDDLKKAKNELCDLLQRNDTLLTEIAELLREAALKSKASRHNLEEVDILRNEVKLMSEKSSERNANMDALELKCQDQLTCLGSVMTLICEFLLPMANPSHQEVFQTMLRLFEKDDFSFADQLALRASFICAVKETVKHYNDLQRREYDKKEKLREKLKVSQKELLRLQKVILISFSRPKRWRAGFKKLPGLSPKKQQRKQIKIKERQSI